MHRTIGIVAVTAFTASAHAQIADFNTWTLVEDPASPFFDGSVALSSQIDLTASDASGSTTGIVPNGTDIGYQSVNGMTVADSTSGFAFDRAFSFSIAVDYDASFSGASSGLSFGFGIGEDQLGMNSAGVGFVTQAGLPVAIPFVGPAGGAATVNDVPQVGLLSPAVSSSAASLMGSFHVAYDSASGAITVGQGGFGAGTASSTATFAGGDVSNLWTGDALLASFFIRSDTVTVPVFGTVSTPWSDGSGTVSFSDFRVTSGAAFEVPTPGAAAVFIAGVAGAMRRRRN